MRRRVGIVLCVLLAPATALVVASGAAAAQNAGSRCLQRAATLNVRTVPALAGVRFRLGATTFRTDARGVAEVQASSCTTYRLQIAAVVQSGRERRAHFSRWSDNVFTRVRTVELKRNTALEVGFDVDRLVKETFVDLDGRSVPTKRVSSVTQTNSLGSSETFVPGAPRWLLASRIIRRSSGLRPTQILYSVQRVVIDGASVVRKAQQRFYPSQTQSVAIQLLLYNARISARDRLFGFPIGSGVELKFPDGHLERHAFGAGSTVFLESLPRGTYDVTVEAKGLKSTIPIALTKNQVVELKVVSNVDLLVFFGTLFFGATGLLLVGRPRLRARLDPRRLLHGRLAQRAGRNTLLLVAVCIALGLGAAEARAATPLPPVPTFAYYYIWFDQGSWSRAKRDYPLLGRYSSDDVKVLRQHVTWAQRAGLGGFIVSWKSTPVLNRRLAALTKVAAAKHFKLAIIYQGLDFAREPLPAKRVARDLQFFARTYGANPVFHVFEKPLVIWSGTWRFSRADVRSVARRVRPRVFLLASEKTVADYERVSASVDGDAYYWSSVNPETFTGYEEKLAAMSSAVHARRGLWIAPAAPGFDARLLGGATIVQRDGGRTLRREYDAALSSAPDVVGVISWNEFSENSHLEPSVQYGTASLHALADILGGRISPRTDFDSSDPNGSHFGYGVPLIAGLAFVAFTSLLVGIWRREIHHASEEPS